MPGKAVDSLGGAGQGCPRVLFMKRLRDIAMVFAAVTALAAGVPAGASAADRSKEVIKDCYQDGKLDGNYSRKDLKNAERKLPSDVDEYSDCRAVIQAAQRRGKNGGGGGTGGVPGGGYRSPGATGDPALSTNSGAIAGTKEDLDKLNATTRDRRRAAPKVPVAGRPVAPAARAADVAEAANGLPDALVAALIAVGALCVAGTAFATWRRLPQLRRAPARLLRR